jgi:hypothetical protein
MAPAVLNATFHNQDIDNAITRVLALLLPSHEKVSANVYTTRQILDAAACIAVCNITRIYSSNAEVQRL